MFYCTEVLKYNIEIATNFTTQYSMNTVRICTHIKIIDLLPIANAIQRLRPLIAREFFFFNAECLHSEIIQCMIL